MQSFDYSKPRSLKELCDLLAVHGRCARILAGGTDLIIQMRAGRLSPELVIDVKEIPEFNTLSLDRTGLVIGSAVNCRSVYEHREISMAYPALAESARLVGGVQNQGRASVGGNLCNASPSADLVPPLMVIGAVAGVHSKRGQREVPVEEFCIGPGANALAEDEALVYLRLPAVQPRAGVQYLRFTPRNEMDIAVAGAAVAVVLSGDGQSFSSARIALAAVAPTPLMAQKAADYLQGRAISESAIETAAVLASNATSPIDDMRGSARQREQLTQVLVERALLGAIERARGNPG